MFKSMIVYVIQSIRNKFGLWNKTDKRTQQIGKQFDELEYHRKKYYELKNQCDMIAIALHAGYTSKEEFLNKMRELNKSAEKISKEAHKLLSPCIANTVAESMWKEGFPDQVDRDVIRQKVLDILDMQKINRDISSDPTH